MYQRYYRQRKFGRFFSFALVVGSGLSYYVKSSINLIKNNLSLENILKYEDYLPNNIKIISENLHSFKQNKHIFKKEIPKKEDFNFKNSSWLYKNNLLKKENKDFNINEININKEDTVIIENYLYFKKFKDKLR